MGTIQLMKPFTTYYYLPAKCKNTHQKMPTKIEISQTELCFFSRNLGIDNSIGTYFFFLCKDIVHVPENDWIMDGLYGRDSQYVSKYK